MRTGVLLLCLSLVLLTPTPTRAQDVVPSPSGSSSGPVPAPVDSDEEQNRCLNGYNVVTCTGENVKFAQAYDWLVLVLFPLAGAALFLFGHLVAGRYSWWLAKPLTRLLLSMAVAAGLVFAGLFFAPFIPQASLVRFEVGPLSWLFVDEKFIESCTPCRDGVTNPGLLFGRIRWLVPPQGLLPENPMALIMVALGMLLAWGVLTGIAFIFLWARTGIRAGSGR